MLDALRRLFGGTDMIEAQLAGLAKQINTLTNLIEQKDKDMSAHLEASVAALHTAVADAVAKIQSLEAALAAAQVPVADPAVDAAATTIDGLASHLASVAAPQPPAA